MANADSGGAGGGPIPATHAKALKGPHVRLVAGIGLIVLVTALFLYIYAKRKNAPLTDTSAGTLGGTGQGTTAWDSMTYNVNYTPAAQGSTNNPAPTGGTTGSGTTSPGGTTGSGGSGTPTAGSGGQHPATGGSSGGHKRPRRHTTHPVVHHSTPHTMHHPAVTGGRGTGAGAPKSADPGGTGAGQGGSEPLTVHNSGGGAGGGSVPVLSGIGDGINWLFGGSHPRIPLF